MPEIAKCNLRSYLRQYIVFVLQTHSDVVCGVKATCDLMELFSIQSQAVGDLRSVRPVDWIHKS